MDERSPFIRWPIWGVASLVCAIAVANRSSLAALGPTAQEHFGIDATTLSMFAVLQLAVCALLQVPVGFLLDRFGSAALIVVGGLLMTTGQLVMATVSEVWIAVLARVLIGAGDACTFISAIRLLPEWFSIRRIPTLSQLTGLLGQAGQLLAVTPLALLVGFAGWTGGFLGVVALGLLVSLISALVLRDRPGAGTVIERMTGRLGRRSREAGPLETVRHLLGIPGVRLAFWMHFTSPFAMTVFLVLWGTPFLVGGVGLDPGGARSLLNLTVVLGLVAGLVLGPLTARFRVQRVWFNVVVNAAVAAVWTTVLLWPQGPPLWLLLMLMIALPLGGPVAMIAFDVARSHSPRGFLGFATGLVNAGGMLSALTVILLIGMILDLLGAGSPETYTLGAFRWAFAVQIPFWALGLAMTLVERRRTLRRAAEHGRSRL